MTGRGVLDAVCSPLLGVAGASVGPRGCTGSGVGLGAAGRKGGASGKLCFRHVAGAWECPRLLRWQLPGTWLGPRAGAGAMAKACRTGGPLLAEAQEPGALVLAAAGAPTLGSAGLELVSPAARAPGEAGSRGGWRITGEVTSRWGRRTTGPWAALLARASRSRFSRSSSDTVLGLGRGAHGACGVGSALRACSAASRAGRFCGRRSGE